ncbi:MAG: choice-of-anchor D domain-containing protein [Candidatus Sulfotelmatobacter sp.]
MVRCTVVIFSLALKRFKLNGMRLPQSIIHSRFIRRIHFLTISLAIALLGIVPVSAGAATAQLVCTPAELRFGSVVVGQTETLLVTVTNTGQTSLTVSGLVVSNPEFSASGLSLPMVLLAGQSVDVSVSFTPTSLSWTSGSLHFSSNASNSNLTLGVAGAGVSSEAVNASPSIVSFGPVAMGTSTTVPVVLKNDRPWNVTLLAAQIMGSEFSIGGPGLPLSLKPGQSVTLNVTFAPQSAGMTGGSLFISGPEAATIPLTGTGTTSSNSSKLTVAPAPLNFGDVPVGTTQTLPITMSAVGASVTVSSAGSSSSQFVLSGASFPFTIAAGQSVSFNVAFTPQSSGTISGSLSFASNASSSGTLESLTGIGTATQYSVNLSWNPSSDVMGYNVYRSTAANGKYSKINSSVNPNTAYTDNTVVSGQTYYYAATSLNSSGQESSLSTPPVGAAVP